MTIDGVLEIIGGLLLGLAVAKGMHLAHVIRCGPRVTTCAWCGGNVVRMDDPERREKMRSHLLVCEDAPYMIRVRIDPKQARPC